MTFRVAPATLTFRDVTDVRLAVDFGNSGHQRNMNELSIAAISRTPVAGRTFGSKRQYYRWRIELNMPQGSEITFGASGYSQVLRAAPVLTDEQRLPATDRA